MMSISDTFWTPAQTQQDSFISSSSRTAHRMRLEVILVLLINLMFSDGWDHFRFNYNRHNTHPCQRSRNNNAYNNFKNRHILAYDFDTDNLDLWAEYLTEERLCGRSTVQSFLEHDERNRIKRICNGRGREYRDNMCISERMFTVFVVESTLRDGQCQVERVYPRLAYVIVACDVIINRCLPVHYHRQTSTPPSQNDEICRPSRWHG